ncbi:ABC transporter ATP-binding protein [Ramlibacter sp. AN1133]|uniref:ABC transporter ATP-binding protein n=1 Tax=Ramlibacter sp. AN1133 TaxID=3133429 RepID=UPI0030C0ADE5
MPLLEVKDLSVELHTHRGPAFAVRDVSFALEPGETLGIVGESGSGKSLTVLAILGLLPEHARVTGSIVFEGRELVGQPERAMCALRGDRIGMIFQEPMTALNPVHTVGHQVAEPLRLHRGVSASAARKEAIALLDRVGIPDAARRIDAYPHQFSGGQRQRITIAMALACGPDLLIADEPTTALDVTIQRQILDLIRELVAERHMALILISHNLGVIAHNVQRMLVMYGGSVVESGPTTSVFAHRRHPYTLGLFAARPGLRAMKGQRLATIPGTVPDLVDLPRGCPFAGRCGWTIPECDAGLPAAVEVEEGHRARCIRLEVVGSERRAGSAPTPALPRRGREEQP